MAKGFHILLVEDNPADADLTRESLETSKMLVDLSVVTDGVAAIEFLQQKGAYAAAKQPELIVLDLNLPRKNGQQVLAFIKNDPDIRRIPVVILTSSDAETDIVRSYELGANCYVKKPLDLNAFQTIIQTIEQFWFTIVRLPPPAGS